MLSVGIGPFSLSIGHLLLVLAFIVALVTGALAGRKENLPISGALADIFLAAMVGARIGFVVRYFEHYQDDWLGIIDIRDGGFGRAAGSQGLPTTLFYNASHLESSQSKEVTSR